MLLSKLKKTNIAKIAPYLKPYMLRTILALIAIVPVGAMDAIIALALKPYMDVVMIEKNTSVSFYIPIMIIIFSLFQSFMSYIITYLTSWVGGKLTNDLKLALFSKMLSYETAFFDRTTSGNIQMRFNTDVDTACSGLINHFKVLATRILASISLVIVLFWNSWKLAIIASVILISALFPLTKIRKRISELVRKNVSSNSNIAMYFNESFNGNKVVTAYNLSQYQKNRFSISLKSVFELSMKIVRRTGVLSPIMHFVIALGIAIIIWMGSYLIASNQLTPGGFVSFITALLLLYQPIKSLGNDFHSIQMSFLALDRIFEILERKPNINNAHNAIKTFDIKNSIEYKNVCFAYNKNQDVLKNINLVINIGETIAFVGNSGGGKSTIVNLLPRFYEISSGSICINGINIKKIDLHSLRDKISFIFQDNFLFAGTIRDNIILNNKSVNESKLQSAVKAAYLDDFINSLENGLDTYVGEKGVLLSGGQKQRIAIARAFFKDTPIVILDEATSALDNKSESIVQMAINNLMSDRTVLIIAHRLSTIKNANKIVVLNQGEIVEIGSHNELVDKKGFYFSLLNT